MSGKKALLALAVTAVLGVASAAGNEIPDRDERGGAVTPCSLVGVNPAYHPEIFGNPAAAKSFGFVKSREGTWQVQNNCLSSLRENQKR